MSVKKRVKKSVKKSVKKRVKKRVKKSVKKSVNEMNHEILASRLAKNNPFAVQRTEQFRFRFPTGNWDSNLQKLATLEHRAAVVGRHGRGKTTLLLELGDRLESRKIETSYTFVSRDAAIRSEQVLELIDPNNRQRVAIVDGIERFHWLQRDQIFRASRALQGLVVAVHGACRLPTWIRCQCTPALLDELLSELQIDDMATRDFAHRSFARRRGNIREVFRDLYDLSAQR